MKNLYKNILSFFRFIISKCFNSSFLRNTLSSFLAMIFLFVVLYGTTHIHSSHLHLSIYLPVCPSHPSVRPFVHSQALSAPAALSALSPPTAPMAPIAPTALTTPSAPSYYISYTSCLYSAIVLR